jgi:tetratricopeptide (TPR) repeat protein
MADKDEIIQYTPEELSEIERILSILPGSEREAARPSAAVPAQPVLDEEEFEEEPYGESGEADTFQPYEGESVEEPEEGEILDVSGMIQEVPDEESVSEEYSPAEPAARDEIEEGGFDFAPLAEEPVEEAPSAAIEEDLGSLSTGAQFDVLTAGEPASVDTQDIPEEILEEVGPSVSATSPVKEPEFDEFPAFEETAKSAEPDVSLEGVADSELPDLSDISFGETRELSEAASQDIPEIDMGSFGDLSEPASMEKIPAEPEEIKPVSGGFDRGGPSPLEDMSSFDTTSLSEEVEIPKELASEMPNIPSMGDIDDMIAHEPIPEISEPSVGPSFDTFDEPFEQEAAAEQPSQGIDLSESELKKLKHAIMLYPPGLMRAVKSVILNDRLSDSDTRLLVSMILTGRNDNDVRRFIEDRLHEKIDMEEPVTRRRVISSRREYSTGAGRERQKRLFKRTAVCAIGIFVLCISTVLIYQFVYKPYKAKSLISEGVGLILKRAEVGDERKNFKKAEEIFAQVDREYVKDYLPGYHRYARAYLDKKKYPLSLEKLNKAFELHPGNVGTLNGLGYFYKKVPDNFFEDEARANLKKWYFSKVPMVVDRIRTKYDLAIDFHLKAKRLDPKNITALVGIGDVYFQQGDYLKARRYYEDILRIDPDSAAGYSGLVNLYIERDDFGDLLTIFVDLREKELFEKLPSPLLGNFAEYLLSKKATEDSNIRIDYGIISDRIKDKADNPFPAVRTVLSALHARDPEYPPLYLHYAKFAYAQKNPALAKGYLDQAIQRADARGEKYYGALSLMGEYYYRMKDPVRSYRYLKEALASLASPPEFTQEDFYKETESPGRTNAVIGNVFYYYFDTVTPRFGDDKSEEKLEASAPDTDAERNMNYDVAMKYYEAAAKEGYRSPELSYNLGRVYYLKGLYENAANQWLNNYEDFTTTPELMFALGNAFYHMGNSESAKAEFQRLISYKEHQADEVTTVVPTREEHIRLFSSLSAAYNNLGAVYLLKGSDTRSNVCFWKSIDYAHRLGHESEFARVNLARTIRKKGDSRQPVLDENIPFSVNVYRAEDRKNRDLE